MLLQLVKSCGLPDEILNKAKNLLKEDDISIEELLKSIYDSKITIEKEKQDILKNLTQVELLRKSLEDQKNKKQTEEKQIVENAKVEAKDIIVSAKDEVNYTIKELEVILDKWKAFDDLDISKLSDSEIIEIVKDIKTYSISDANKLRKNLNKELQAIYKNDSNNNDKNISDSITKSDLKEGMKINLNNINEIATIISIPPRGNQIQVQVRNIKMNVKINDITNIADNNENNHLDKSITKNNKNSYSAKSKTVSTEINLIGQNVDDACLVLDKYLDDCYLAKLEYTRIVHGKGTGKLREGIHKFLKKHPHVKSYRLGTFGEGEMGVTIVELKR